MRVMSPLCHNLHLIVLGLASLVYERWLESVMKYLQQSLNIHLADELTGSSVFSP